MNYFKAIPSLLLNLIFLESILPAFGEDDQFFLPGSNFQRNFIEELLAEPVDYVETTELATHSLQLKNQHIGSQKLSNGWFAMNIYQDGRCNDVAVSKGVLTNQCLYSQRLQRSFFVSCNSGAAFVNLYNDSSCTELMKSSPYTLNTCQTQPAGNTEQYTCTSTVFNLQLPLGFSYVLFEYFTDNACQSTMIMYHAFINNLCYLQYPNMSVILRFPNKITYEDNKSCAGQGTQSPLRAYRCFDWSKAYGYGYSDDFEPNAPNMLIVPVTTTTSRPTQLPTALPTLRPTATREPTNTPAPTAIPTTTPTATPSISFAPTISMRPTAQPTSATPTVAPSASPSPLRKTAAPTRSINYMLALTITQSFQNLHADKYIEAPSSLDHLGSTIAASSSLFSLHEEDFTVIEISTDEGDSSLAINSMSTSLALTEVNVSYILQIMNTRDLGFGTVDEAYSNISTTIHDAVVSGIFTKNWQLLCSKYDLLQFQSVTSDRIIFSSYSSQIIADSPTFSPTTISVDAASETSKKLSLTTIVTIVFTGILGICCLPIFAFIFMYLFRQICKFKISFSPINDERTVEMAQAQIIPEDAEFSAIGLTMGGHSRVAPLPEAKMVQPRIVAHAIEL